MTFTDIFSTAFEGSTSTITESRCPRFAVRILTVPVKRVDFGLCLIEVGRAANRTLDVELFDLVFELPYLKVTAIILLDLATGTPQLC